MNPRMLSMLLLALGVACNRAPEPKKTVPLPTFRHEMKGLLIDSAGVAAQDSSLAVFYRMNQFQTVWYREVNRKAAVQYLSNATCDGLFPEDYNTQELSAYEKRFDRLTDKELVAYDILLTTAFRRFLNHLGTGKLAPSQLYGNWELPAHPLDVDPLLSAGISGDSLHKIVAYCKPPHELYQRLEKALDILESYPRDQMRKIPELSSKLKQGDTASAVVLIKKRLIYWRDMKQPDSLTTVYDEATVRGIKNFQARHGLAVDGVIGKGTLEALNFTKDQRRRQIIANMERWRWFPRNFGEHYVIVNIPGYEMALVKEGDTLQTHRIVVGKSDRSTPVLVSKFSNVIINPTWTVPPTIIREDLTPAAKKNRSYFASKQITIFNWKGDTVSAQAWNPEKFNSYRYVQRPGPDNSLGMVKFDFPNRFLVYLHDTNHRDLFARQNRSLSSGCVRVDDPLPLAAHLIDNEKIDVDSIVCIIDTRKTKVYKVKQPVRIHQLYWTAWSENRKLIFRDDIYQLDAALYDALRKKIKPDATDDK